VCVAVTGSQFRTATIPADLLIPASTMAASPNHGTDAGGVTRRASRAAPAATGGQAFTPLINPRIQLSNWSMSCPTAGL
jgi:hypothetical protein